MRVCVRLEPNTKSILLLDFVFSERFWLVAARSMCAEVVIRRLSQTPATAGVPKYTAFGIIRIFYRMSGLKRINKTSWRELIFTKTNVQLRIDSSGRTENSLKQSLKRHQKNWSW
jgi:hypothetical protein